MKLRLLFVHHANQYTVDVGFVTKITVLYLGYSKEQNSIMRWPRHIVHMKDTRKLLQF
jgi:hypothetical protein